jgi:serine protease inhibitor
MIKEPTIMKNIKEIGNKLPIRVIIKLYNDGENIIPKQCNILSQSDSNLFIIETLVNNGNVILPGQIIEVSLYIFFRDYNNIPLGISTLNIHLYNKNIGKIGENGQIKINILPSDLFISQTHPNFRNSLNEFNIIPNNSSLLSSYQKNN